MASSFTTNKDIEKPGNGDYVDTWNVPLNGDMTVVDYALGSTIAFNATAGSQTLGSYNHTTKVLDTYSYIPLIISVTGAMSANVTYTIPSGVGGQWIIRNTTTDATGGPWTVTFASGGGGTSITADRGTSSSIFCDGTNVRTLSTGVPGSTTQVIYNNSGSFAASSALTWNGTTLTASNLATGGNITATGTITATGAITSSDAVTAFSDRSLKRDVQTIEDATAKVQAMRGVTFEMINSGERGLGVIAQEVQAVFPEAVRDNNGILSVAYGNLVGVLIEAVKEMAVRIDELERKTPA
jgi:hypothetical protein